MDEATQQRWNLRLRGIEIPKCLAVSYDPDEARREAEARLRQVGDHLRGPDTLHTEHLRRNRGRPGQVQVEPGPESSLEHEVHVGVLAG